MTAKTLDVKPIAPAGRICLVKQAMSAELVVPGYPGLGAHNIHFTKRYHHRRGRPLKEMLAMGHWDDWMRQCDSILERRFITLADVEAMLADGWEARHERDVVKFSKVAKEEVEAREAARRAP